MATLPEFLDPESTRYQPWAEKQRQTGNAAKEKRPLEAFLQDLDLTLVGYGEPPPLRWRPWSESSSLARFGQTEPARDRQPGSGPSQGLRRGRRRGGRPPLDRQAREPATAGGAAPPAPGRPPGGGPRPPAAGQPNRDGGLSGAGSTGSRRRRRRRRPGAKPAAGPAGGPAAP
ncbi:MAG TPA: hypothetical protein VNN74_10225 [Candidatus Micrarchaeia archaeon]|nr:hypothetical protein [Candidatus Micrarchaeia archaeon]